MEMDISLLQERGRDRGKMSRFHVRSPAAIALAPAAAAAPVTSITLISNSHSLFPETELSDEEDPLQHSVVPSPQETVPARRTIVPMRVHEKAKEPEEALKQICGICLSEEQRATLQGLLNCCSHYFCFTCVLEWSKAESRCPVCKRRFNTIAVADVGSGLRKTAIRVEKRDQVYERPSYAQTSDRVVQRGENNMNTGDSSSSLFGRSAPSGVSQRPPALNIHQASLQEFDLNPSPVETPDEHRRAELVSTSTGRQTTLERRRALERRMRMLLFRHRAATNALQSRFENFRDAANAKDQLIPIVKKSIKHICAQSPLDQSAFMNVARLATNTILALSGIAHNSDRVVAVPFPFPGHCSHAGDGQEPAFLARRICSPCFESFVGDVVGHIASMFSSS